MKAKEIDPVELPLMVVKGKAPDSGSTKVMAQYPSNRAESLDADSTELNSLYKSGLIFTAYNSVDKTNTRLRTFRHLVYSPENPSFDKGNRYTVNQASIANILMPKSQTDIDTISHKFNDVDDSLAGRADSIGANVLSTIASGAVFGAIDSFTKGIMADRGEQLHTTSRAMYQGAENRTKVYSWNLTPRTVHDLIEIMRIYEIFSQLSYGRIGASGYASELKDQIDSWYSDTILSKFGLEDQKDDSIIAGITSFLSNAITVSNPTIWTVKNFGEGSKFDQFDDVFGPAQISNIRFDKSSDGKFRGLAIAPNLPNTFVLEVTFREILALDRKSYMGGL